MRGALAAKSWPVPELLLSPESSMYQDTARTIPAVANNDPVGSWSDLAAAASNRVQGTAGNRPLLKTNLLNGYRGLDFDGVNDSMLGALVAHAASTFFLVAKEKSAPTATTRGLYGMRVTGTNRATLFTDSDVGTGYCYFPTEASGNVHIGGVPNQWNVICMNFESLASATFRIGGGAGVNFNPHDNHGSCVLDSTPADNAVSPGDFQLVALRRYASSLNAGDMNLVGGYLAQKYGLTWTNV